MFDIRAVERENRDDISSVTSWCTEMYDRKFSNYFKQSHDLYSRLTSKEKPVTDKELEDIFTLVPLNMIQVSEELNNLRLSLEITKSKMKRKKREFAKASAEKSQTKRDEEAADLIIEDEILCLAYTTVIQRVESEMSYSRELLQTCKRIWDARRSNAANTFAVSESTSDKSSKSMYDRADTDFNDTGRPVVYEDIPNYDPRSSGSKYYIR